MGWSNNSLFQILIVTGVNGGVFVYSPAPGPGNLVYSIAQVSGTDPYGNAYLPGSTSYKKILATDFRAVQQDSGGLGWWVAGGNAGPWNLVWSMALQADEVGMSLASNVNPGSITVGETAAALQVFGKETISGSVTVGPVLDVTNTSSSSGPIIRAVATAVGDLYYGGNISGDTSARIVLDTASPSGAPRIRFGPGNAGPDTILARFNANQLQVLSADLDIATTGRGLQVAEGANARMGLATLVGGTVTVANTTITGTTRIIYAVQSAGGAQGFLRIASRTIGTNFTITSTSNTETSTVAWLLVEPG